MPSPLPSRSGERSMQFCSFPATPLLGEKMGTAGVKNVGRLQDLVVVASFYPPQCSMKKTGASQDQQTAHDPQCVPRRLRSTYASRCSGQTMASPIFFFMVSKSSVAEPQGPVMSLWRMEQRNPKSPRMWAMTDPISVSAFQAVKPNSERFSCWLSSHAHIIAYSTL